MKFYDRPILFCVAIVGVAFLSSSALAVNLIYEPFDYTSGVDLAGQRNTSAGTTAGAAIQADTTVGNIWKTASTSPAANSIDIASGSLNGPSELKTSVGNSLTIIDGTNNGAANRLAFRANTVASGPPTGENITTGTIYYSFLLRVDSLTGANNIGGDYFISLNNTANAPTTANPTVHPAEMRARIDPNDSSKFSLGMFTQHASVTQTDPAWVNGLTVGQQIFVVGSFNVSGTNSTNLWVSPDPLTFGLAGAPTPTAQDLVSGSNGTSIGSILLHQRNLVPGLTMDELRVATSWAEVTPLSTPTLYWDIDGSNPGAGGATPSGTWDASTNWNNTAAGDGNALAWTSGGAAVFSAGSDANGTYTITVSGTQSASQVTFEDGGTVTLSGGTLNLTGSLHKIFVNSGQTANIDSVVGGSVGFIKDGNGTLVLTANETYSGTTTIDGGTLQVGNGGTTGTLPTSSAITDNGRLTVNRSNAVVQGTDFSGAAITGTGGLTQAGSGTLTLNVANTYSGTTRAGAGTLLLTNSLAVQNSTLDMNATDTGAVSFDSSLSAVTLGGLTGSRNLSLLNSASGAMTVSLGSSANPAAPYSGVLSGSGSSITKIGTNTQVLSGANTYGGGTTVNAGILQFGKTFAMPSTGNVVVNSSGTLAVNSNGTDEWTESTDTSVGGTIGSLIAGRGGQGAANQITWMPGSSMGIDTTNALGGSMTYSGVIGNFRTTSGTTNSVGFTKVGVGTLQLSGTNTFSGQLATATGGGTLILTGTNANAGSTMATPTVSIGGTSTVQIGASNAIPNGSLIATQGGNAVFEVLSGFSQTVRSISGNNGIVTVDAGATLTIADQAGDDYVFGNGSGTANVHSVDTGKIYKTGPGSLTLFGDAGANFNGELILQSGTLKLSRNQALGTSTGTGRLTVEGGQLGRSNTPTSNFTYSLAILDLHVFRYDLSDAPAQTSQFNAATITTLKENDVEFNITNSGAQTAASGRFVFLGDIRNNDPFFEPGAPDRGITKTGNGVLQLSAATSYRGPTTVQDGVLLVINGSTLGDYTQATIGTLNLKGGQLATTANRTSPIKNPVVVDGAAGIAHMSTTINLSSVLMEFDSDSIVGTSGSLTISNLNTGTGNTVFKPSFTGKGFNFGLPINILAATGTTGNVKSNELQSGNTTGTQTFSGAISGGGSYRRTAAGETVFSGHNTFSGGTTVDDGTLTVSGAAATFGGGDVTVNAGSAAISAGVTNAILDTAKLTLFGGGTPAFADVGFINLAAGINERVTALILGAASQANGTYGSTLSSATFQNDEYFSGTGIVTVGPAGLPGDFNSDGKVDASDYATWRKNDSANATLPNDGGAVSQAARYSLWRTNFGNPPGAGNGDGLNSGGAVPEPATLSLLICAVGTGLVASSRRRRS